MCGNGYTVQAFTILFLQLEPVAQSSEKKKVYFDTQQAAKLSSTTKSLKRSHQHGSIWGILRLHPADLKMYCEVMVKGLHE